MYYLFKIWKLCNHRITDRRAVSSWQSVISYTPFNAMRLHTLPSSTESRGPTFWVLVVADTTHRLNDALDTLSSNRYPMM